MTIMTTRCFAKYIHCLVPLHPQTLWHYKNAFTYLLINSRELHGKALCPILNPSTSPIPVAVNIFKLLHKQTTHKVTNYTTFTKVTKFRQLLLLEFVIIRKQATTKFEFDEDVIV